MQIIEIPLDQLRPHPANANVMPEALLAKLAAHLARTDRYPPIIVRAVAPDGTGGLYQVLDGHHRVLALGRLGRSSARCVVWDVDDAEALVLLTTLNGLRGRDDPRKRAGIVAELAGVMPLSELARRLPEQVAQLEHLVSLRRPPPPPGPPRPAEDVPVPVHFFLLPAQRRRLDRRLAALGGTREQALMQLVDQGAGDDDATRPQTQA